MEFFQLLMNKNKIKDIFEDIILDIKNKLFSSKYVLKGKCNKCGNCCRKIMFADENGFVKSEEKFLEMQKKYRHYRRFKVSGVVHDRDNITKEALTFECKYIAKNNKCKIYPFRPFYCKSYPRIDSELIYQGVTMIEGCGFYFDIDKKFDSYLK